MAKGDGEAGARGRALTEGLDDRNQRKSTLRMIRQAVVNGWPMDGVDRKAIISRLEAIALECDDERAATGAAKTIADMASANLKALIELDRIERLEAGEATEIVQFPTLDLKAK